MQPGSLFNIRFTRAIHVSVSHSVVLPFKGKNPVLFEVFPETTNVFYTLVPSK